MKKRMTVMLSLCLSLLLLLSACASGGSTAKNAEKAAAALAESMLNAPKFHDIRNPTSAFHDQSFAIMLSK